MFPPPEITLKMAKPQPFCLLRTKHYLISKFQLLVELLQLHTVLKFELLADLPSKVHLNFDHVHFTKFLPTLLQNITTNERNML